MSKNSYEIPYRVTINVEGETHGCAISADVDTSAYAAGNVLFSTTLPFNDVTRIAGRSVKLEGITAAEDGGQAPSLTFLFFHAIPTQTGARKAAAAWGVGTSKKFAGMIRITGSDWYTVGSKSFLSNGGAATPITVAGTDLYMVAIADSAYDAVLGGDLSLTFHFERDL